MSTAGKLRLFLSFLLTLTILLKTGCERPANPPAAASSAEPAGAKTIELSIEVEIDFRNETPPVRGQLTLPPGGTAFDALAVLAKNNELSVESTGDGETRFVVGIGTVANQGASGDNWTYRVNGQLGDRSSGIFELKPGDKVAWVFGKYP